MKTTKKNFDSKKKLLTASTSLLISAAMLGTSTYAWFTMNKEVTVTGMQMKTKVGSNLLVTGDNVEANYTNDLVQLRSALLEPVSSKTGADTTFFYTVNAKANGDANVDKYSKYNESSSLTNDTDKVGSDWTRSSAGAGKTAFDSAFNTAYGNGAGSATPSGAQANAYGYVDYVFYVKATSEEANQELRLTECNLIRNNAKITDVTGSGAKTDNDLAWRVALFADRITNQGNGVESDKVTESGDTPKIILTRTGSENQKANYACGGENEAPSEMTLGYNTWADSKSYIDKIDDAGATVYYKVVARIWLEGEDKSCKSSTYALLTSDYELGLQLELVSSTETDLTKASVTSIGSDIDNDTGKIMKSGS